MSVNPLFLRAEQAFRGRRLDEARQLLEEALRDTAPDPGALHLLALVEKGRGKPAESRQAFDAAIALSPDDRRIRNNYGNLLLGIGEADAAIEQFDQALALAPDFAEAAFNKALALEALGRHDEALGELERMLAAGPPTAHLLSAQGNNLLALGRLAEAAVAFDEALKLDPRRATALQGRARVAMQRGEPRAATYFERAVDALPNDPALRLAWAEALEAEGDPRAIEIAEQLVVQRPDWPDGQSALARLRWAAGEEREFARDFVQALETRPRDGPLWAAYLSSLASADLWTAAANGADVAIGKVDAPQLRLLGAVYHSECGNVERAEQLFATVPPEFPGRRRAEMRHLIRTGVYDRALALADEDLLDQPWDVSSWAFIGILWRLVGDERAHWLHGQEGLIGVQQLELTGSDIEAIAAVLRRLHRTRAHPLGQSLRGGTQTRGQLFDRAEPEIGILRDAIERAVKLHWDGLPPLDAAHPLLRHRDKPPRFAGSWSVRLTGGGFHVAHIHEDGVVSSACYLVVPETNEPEEGWLEIGRPPPELQLALEPLATVEPRPGRLALFPSTLLHGTRPFTEGERLTAAFDVVAD